MTVRVIYRFFHQGCSWIDGRLSKTVGINLKTETVDSLVVEKSLKLLDCLRIKIVNCHHEQPCFSYREHKFPLAS